MLDHSVAIFRPWGIPVKLHWSLLLFLPYVAFAASYQFRAVVTALGIDPESLSLPVFGWGIVLAIGLFVGVLLHELAHAAVAIRAGARIHSITLMMLGGVTRIQQDVPLDREAWMAFAGPLASFGIAVVSYGVFLVAQPLPDLQAAGLAFAM